MSVVAPPLPLDRALRPGGYATPGAVNPFAPPASSPLAILLSGLFGNQSTNSLPGKPLSSAPQVPVQEVTAKLDPRVQPEENPYAPRPGFLSAVLGKDNPLANWTNDNRNLLMGVGSALLSGPRLDFSNLPMYAAMDDQRRTQAAEWGKSEKSKRQLIDALTNYGEDYADIAQGLASGAIDTNSAWNAMFKRHADLKSQADTTAKNKGNASLLKTPELRAAVESGAMDFADAYKLEHDDESLMNVGNGTVYDPNTGKWLRDPNAGGTGAAAFDDISGIRKEVQALPSYKNLAQAMPIYQSMSDTAGRNSKASDLNLVYGLGKIMDPTSVVREGEMVMVKNTASLPDWLVGSINALNGGQQLQPDTRKAILAEAYSRMKSYEDAFNTDAQMYRGIADRYKINPADILPQFDPASPWQSQQDVRQVTQQEYQALPSGAKYIAPDGSIRVKP